MTLLRKAVAASLDVRHYPCLTVLEREEPTKVVLQHLRDVLSKNSGAWDNEQSKTRVLTITGVKGCGKTRLIKDLAGYAEDRPGEQEKPENKKRKHELVQQAVGQKQRGPIESSDVGGKAVVVSFNEDAPIGHMAGKRGCELLRSFGVQLLAYNKVPLEIAEKIASFDEAILLVRENLELSATEPLTVLVDEIIMLKDLNEKKDWQVMELVTYLKQNQDKTIPGDVPLLFVFSSLTEQYMTACATASGRVVETVNLECLSDNSATLSLLPDDVRQCIKEHGALQALYKSLGGHPRAITEGLALIPVSQLRAAVKSATEYTRVETRIIIASKLNLLNDLHTELSKYVPLWMSFNFDAECNREHKERMRLLGYLQRKDDTEVLMPLLLRHYALASGDAPLKAALRACYSADNDLWEGGNETRAEALLCSWETVLKLANPDGAKRGQFFAGAQAKNPAFLDDVLTWPRRLVVKNVESLMALPGLKAGTTLVSKKTTEAGVEYVTAFTSKKGEHKKKQEAALVQVKFGVKKGPAWGTIQDKMQNSPARKAVDKLKVACSYIVYTTYANVPQELRERFLYFNHEGLKKFTAKLGPLKLHFAQRMSHMFARYGNVSTCRPQTDPEQEANANANKSSNEGSGMHSCSVMLKYPAQRFTHHHHTRRHFSHV